jgi:hypothetical protein
MKSSNLLLVLTATMTVAACNVPEAHQPPSVAPLNAVEEHTDDLTILATPHMQQETLLCVPTSAAMILAYYGDPQSPHRLKVLASGGRYDGHLPFNDFSITLYRDIVKAVQTLGYSWMERSYPDTHAGFAEGLLQIESQIRNGHPVMVDVSEPEGHTFVVSGFDRTARRLLIVDPNRPSPGTLWLSYDDFESLWNEHSFGHSFRSLVTTQPR